MTNDHRRVDEQMAQEVLLDEPDFLREIVERVLQEVLEAEMTEHIGAAPYERTDARKGHRNGHKPRMLRTRVGTLSLLVPKDREGTFSTRLFSRYQRNEKALCLALMEMYVERRGLDQEGQGGDRGVVRHLLDQEPRLLPGRLPGFGAWGVEKPPARSGRLPLRVRGRPLRESQGRASDREPGGLGGFGGEGRRVARGPRSRGGGHRERGELPSAVPLPEGARPARGRAGGLRRPRGPEGRRLSPLPGGLVAALCQVHYQRNLLGMVGAKSRKELAAALRVVFAQASREQALGMASEVARRWRGKGYEKVACHIEENIEECLACLSFPESHRRRIRTTNGQERLNQEIKRRTRVVRIFPNPQACLRLVSALAVEQSEEWVTGRRYLDMRELEEQRHEERERHGVKLMEK
jgi:putative transposase